MEFELKVGDVVELKSGSTYPWVITNINGDDAMCIRDAMPGHIETCEFSVNVLKLYVQPWKDADPRQEG